MVTRSGEWQAIHNWRGPVPDIEKFHRIGYYHPPTDDMRRACEDCARYDGTGQWYVSFGEHGFCVVLLGHPDGKRRYLTGAGYMYHEEPVRETDNG